MNIFLNLYILHKLSFRFEFLFCVFFSIQAHSRVQDNYIFQQLADRVEHSYGDVTVSFADKRSCIKSIVDVRKIELPITLPNGASTNLILGEAFSQADIDNIPGTNIKNYGKVGRQLEEATRAFRAKIFSVPNNLSSESLTKTQIMTQEIQKLSDELNAQAHKIRASRPEISNYKPAKGEFSPAKLNAFLREFKLKVDRFQHHYLENMSAEEKVIFNKNINLANELMAERRTNGNVANGATYNSFSLYRKTFDKLSSNSELLGQTEKTINVGGFNKSILNRPVKEGMSLCDSHPIGGAVAGQILNTAMIIPLALEVLYQASLALTGVENFTFDTRLFNKDFSAAEICENLSPDPKGNLDYRKKVEIARKTLELKIRAVIRAVDLRQQDLRIEMKNLFHMDIPDA